MIVVKNRFGITEYREESKTILATYHGRMNKKLGMEHLEGIVEFYKSHDVLAAIIDIREIYGSFVNLLGYMSHTFYPAISRSNLKAQAIILKNDLIINHLAKKLILITKMFSIESQIFFSKEDAQNWIDSKNGVEVV